MHGTASTPMEASTLRTSPPEAPAIASLASARETDPAATGTERSAAPLRHPEASVAMAFGAAAVDALDRHDLPNASYWRAMLEHGPAHFAPNLAVRPGIVRHAGRIWPLAVSEHVVHNSYPCSLHTQYIAYPREELATVPGPTRRNATGLALFTLDLLLRAIRIDRVVQWNSWLLSTNPVDEGVGPSVDAVTRTLAATYPRHAILYKNLLPGREPTVAKAFRRAGYRLLTSRKVYLFEGRPAEFLSRNTVQRDLRAFSKPGDHTFIGHADVVEADFPRILDLYRQLYVEKHSALNPRYTVAFVERAHREQWLEFHGLRHRSGRLDAVYACFTTGRNTTTPFVGYDLTLPQETGLYRRLVTRLLQQVAEYGQLLNFSSGAGEFKRRRGGLPCIECNALHTAHLPPPHRAAFRLLEELANRIARPFLESTHS
jgi:hypothetical protein